MANDNNPTIVGEERIHCKNLKGLYQITVTNFNLYGPNPHGLESFELFSTRHRVEIRESFRLENAPNPISDAVQSIPVYFFSS